MFEIGWPLRPMWVDHVVPLLSGPVVVVVDLRFLLLVGIFIIILFISFHFILFRFVEINFVL